MDGSVVGRGCIVLMVRVVYHGRALPLCWMVVAGSKGHFPQKTHQALLAQLLDLVPADAQVTFLGDGEFDGTDLHGDLRRATWQYVFSNPCISRFTFHTSRIRVRRMVSQGTTAV